MPRGLGMSDMGALTAFVPWPYRVLALILLAVALAGFGWVKGADQVRAEWDAAVIKQSLITARVQKKQSEATVQVVTHFVDRIKVVHDTGDTIIKEVPQYVPSDSCLLPAGFRVLHDAAASNAVPDPTRVADAQAVAAQDVATTIATNYRQYFELVTQLEALQEWVRAQEVSTHNE